VEECGPHLKLPDAVLHAEVAHQAHTLARVPAGPPDTCKMIINRKIKTIIIPTIIEGFSEQRKSHPELKMMSFI